MSSSASVGELGHQLDRLARLHEDDRARALRRRARPAGRPPPPARERRVASFSSVIGGFHIAIVRWLPGEPSSSTTVKSSKPGQPLGELGRVGDRRAGQHEPRRGAVGVGDAPQPPQHVADVGAEHAAVDVRLVDDDEREVGEEVAPRAVVGQDPDVQHVGVGEHDVGAPADRGALLARRVAVVDRLAHPVHPERVQRARLVLGERLGRVQVERARLGVAAEHVERRQLEAQRLARRRAGGDDRRARPRGVQRLRLVRVEALDPARGERRGRRRGAAPRAARRALPGRRFWAACITSRSSSRPARSSSSHGWMSRTTAITVDARRCSDRAGRTRPWRVRCRGAGAAARRRRRPR